MKYFFTIITLFVVINLKAQGDPRYNAVINKAENFILENNYDSALKSYDKLKTDFNYIYAKDIYNALITANKQKDWEKSYFWAKLFLAKGVDKKFFDQKKFEEFKKTKFWRKILKLNIKNNINTALKGKIDSLVNIDQGKFVLLKEKEIPDIYDVTANIDKTLFKLDKEYGGITEDNTGPRIINDTVFSFLPAYSVLLRHSYQSKRESSYFNYKKKNNAIEKDLFYTTMDYNLMPVFVYKNETYFLKEEFLSEDKEELLNYIQKAKKIIRGNFSDFALFYPLAKISSFANKESENNFSEMLNTFYYKQ